jgi:phosphatidylinositol-3-phosphatase
MPTARLPSEERDAIAAIRGAAHRIRRKEIMNRMLIVSLVSLGLVGCGSTASVPIVQAPSANVRPLTEPHGSQVTVVILENKNYNRIIGNPDAPYINKTLIPQGVLLRNSHAIAHPSEPNYVALFSGSTQGIHGDPCPVYFKATNAATELFTAGKTFAGYSESLPHDGYKGCYPGKYDRNHNPWVDFRNVPSSDNLVYHGFPSKVATLVWIVPNLCDDMTSCSIKTGDTWLSENLPPIIAWDAKHDGLLILTYDEAVPDNDGENHIPTVLVGPMLRAGTRDTQYVNDYGVLHTIDKILDISCIDKDCKAPLLTGIWK